LIAAGVSWKYYSPEKAVGGIAADVLYMQQGFKRMMAYPSIPGDTTTSYSRTVNSIMVPIFWQPHAYLFRQRLTLFANLGMTLSYNISSTYKWSSEISGTLETGNYTMKLTRDNRFGYGLCGGAGASWAFGRVEIFGEWRYYIGYADILRNRNKYEQNPLRSPLDNMQVTFGVFVRLGKGGILAPPSPSTAEKIRRRELRKLDGAFE
jgi:hypothetical protein